MSKHDVDDASTRTVVARVFTAVEDAVYIGLGVLLAIAAVVLLVSAAVSFFHNLVQAPMPKAVASLLDRLLLVLIVIELL